MAVDKKTVNKSEKKEASFFAKVGAWFKKAGKAIANFFKKLWAKVKTVQWNAPVKPVIAWSVIGGVLLVAVAIALIVWL
jgi:hypothetical protein